MPVESGHYAQKLALLAQQSGTGRGSLLAARSGNAAESLVGMTFLLVCPGVRPAWAQKGDQQRTMTPIEAVQAGVDYLVIGRPITQADDPAAAFARICEEMAM